MNIGNRIKEVRESSHLTQKELAEKIKLNHSVLSRIESGERPARDEEIKNISKALNVSTDYLLGVSPIKQVHDDIHDALKEDEELLEFWNDLKEREELKILFKQTRELDKSTIQQVIRIIKAIEDEEGQR